MRNLNLTDRQRNGRNGKQFVYVLNCIKESAHVYDNEITLNNDKEAVELFFNVFNEEYNDEYNKRRFPNLQERIMNYLCGLPSVFAVAFAYDDIIEIGKSWGYCQTEKNQSTFVNNWFNVLAFRLIQLANKLGVNI